MERRLAAVLASAALLFGLAACTNEGSAGNKPMVLSTFTIIEDIAKNIAGDAVEVRSITDPGAEIHGYEPTPSDIAAASDADMILANGLNLEHWIDKLLTHSTAKRVTVTEGIEPINIEHSETPNPHAWMSPALAKTYVDNIVSALSELVPDAADTFRSNGGAYKAELDGVDRELTEGLRSLPENRRTLVSCEGAFSYLAREAHMKEGYIWPVNSNGEITSGEISKAASFVRENQVPAVFCESTVGKGPHEQLRQETGVKNGGTLFVDSLSPADGPVPTYLDLISYDVKTIVSGLSQ